MGWFPEFSLIAVYTMVAYLLLLCHYFCTFMSYGLMVMTLMVYDFIFALCLSMIVNALCMLRMYMYCCDDLDGLFVLSC